MAVPFAIITAAAAAAEFFINLFGAISAADNAARIQRAQRQLAEEEARRVEADAEQLLLESGLRAQDYQQEGFRVHGQQVLAYARSGVRLAGSPTARLRETEARIEEGRRRILQRSEFQAGRLRSRAGSIRAAGEVGINPGAVFISHLPNLVESGLAFGQEIDLANRQAAAAQTSVTPAPTRGAQYSAGGGGGRASRAFFPRVIDIS